MLEKVGGMQSKDVLMPVFKSDVMEDDELIHSVGTLGAVADMSPVSMSGTSFDAIAAWRHMSEKYRNERLAKEKTAVKPVPKNSSTQILETNQEETLNETKFQDDYENDVVEISDKRDKLKNSNEQEKSKSIETEKILNKLSTSNIGIGSELLGPDELENLKQTAEPDEQKKLKKTVEPDEQKYIEREKIINKLSSADLEIDPELLVEPEYQDIESHNGLLLVADVMTKKVISVIDSMTIEQVASIFNKRNITGVPVVDYQTKRLKGIILMSDIIRHLFENDPIFSLHEESHSFEPEYLTIMEKKVSEVMQTDIIQVSSDSSIKEACNLMLENNINQVLVTKDNRVKGIFTPFDAVRILAKFDLKIE